MMVLLRALIALVLLALLAGWLFRMWFAVPTVAGRVNSTALAPSSDTALGAIVLRLMQENPDTSGVVPLADGEAAFAARLLLADTAAASIDLRIYIWQKDITGLLLLDAMKRAADRGVRVRLLLDDNGIAGLDPVLAELNEHPNVEIRLFNPFIYRRFRAVSYLLDFSRVNRRMHNKSMTVDGVVAIVGGRNVGDNYFSQDKEQNFFDLDVVALGPAAREVDEDFDRYWASEPVVPAEAILPAPPADGDALESLVAPLRSATGAEHFLRAVENSSLMARLKDGARGFEWVPVTLVSDDPAKGLGKAAEAELMAAQLLKLLREPDSEIGLVSAYFIPGDRLAEVLSDWARDGIRVRTLTNAQEATDVLPVHSGYVAYRDRLLDAGVELWELKSEQEEASLRRQFGLVGAHSSSLHAKSFLVDRDRIFIGSFNFDPRSARLNTEMGYLIESPALAGRLAQEFDDTLDHSAYQVRRAPDGDLEWVEASKDGSVIVHDTEPGTTVFLRALVRVIGWLPVRWLL